MCRRIFEMRMTLLPYLYSAYAKYYFEGVPVFRALVMDYPYDENTYNIEDEYMMGDSILVAPVVESENKREVYLPQGYWYNYWTNERLEGGKAYSIEVPLEIIPVFVKEGSMIPVAKPVEFVTKDTVFEVTVKGYGENLEELELYEDDGLTFNFEKGEYNIIKVKAENNILRIEKNGNFIGVRYKFDRLERI
jgi:alpha-D-xyloside xylohydrolase